MDPETVSSSPNPSDVALAQQVQQLWNAGHQQEALNVLRSRAEAANPWAAAFLAWLFMQQGTPGMDESITWALKAAKEGAPGQVPHTLNNAVAYLPNAPELATRLPELLAFGPMWSSGADFIGQGWSLMAQGHPELGVQVMMLAQHPVPSSEPWFAALVERATARANEIDGTATKVEGVLRELDEASTQAHAAISKARSDLETEAKQAGLLVRTTSSDATNALFQEAAKRNAKDSRFAWAAGLVVLGMAAVVAVLPVILHYLHVGPVYSSLEQIGLHLTSTAALATFAGVLLARARSRDQAAQRAHDISTAMGTMISYSNQIDDPLEKQRFMTMMGQVVLQAHLTSGGKQSGKDDSVSGMIALANLIRPAASASSQS